MSYEEARRGAKKAVLDYIYDNLGSTLEPTEAIHLPYDRWMVGLAATVEVRIRLDENHEETLRYDIEDGSLGVVVVAREHGKFKVVRAPTREELEKTIKKRIASLRPKVIL